MKAIRWRTVLVSVTATLIVLSASAAPPPANPKFQKLNADLEHYKFAGAADMPKIEVVVLENYQGRSATDAYGIAEPANVATAPAIANAVFNALGVRLRESPMTPAAVLGALGRLPSRA